MKPLMSCCKASLIDSALRRPKMCTILFGDLLLQLPLLLVKITSPSSWLCPLTSLETEAQARHF